MASGTEISDPEAEKKSKKPSDSKFKQQRLPAWQPILTAGTVLPAFFAIGVAFIPLGIALLITSNNIQEISVDYTYCNASQSLLPVSNSTTCWEYLEENPGRNCSCMLQLDIDEDFRGKVYMYYGLSNFYQNHRRYVKSRDDNQLAGSNLKPGDISSNCAPFEKDNNGSYAPCGAIANSLFNDTLILREGTGDPVSTLNTGIAWETDKKTKFNNPNSFDGFVHPPNWQKNVYELDLNDSDNNGYENEDLIVWMRTAALPTFRKLYRRIKHVGDYSEGLPKGTYTLVISYNYPVTAFGGRKRMILTTTSWLGGKNPFLGIAYLVVGSICVSLGAIFLVIHIKVGKKPSEIIQSKNLNEKTPYFDEDVQSTSIQTTQP